MLEPIIVDKSQIGEIEIANSRWYKSPLVIRDFYDKKSCNVLVNKIRDYQQRNLSKKSNHIGTILTLYKTRKVNYFQEANHTQKTLDVIFGSENPLKKIHQYLGKLFPNHTISSAKELQNEYSSFVIRIHEKEKNVPIHRDNVKDEGKEYSLSNIDLQLSCVLHLQESEKGGNLVIYDKQWTKGDEKFRNVGFGYSQNVVSGIDLVKLQLQKGDLVIINPNYYHAVTKITGTVPRISLGMFLGIYKKESRIVTWA